MRIGIATLHNFNFGSVLQCYATQEYLKSKDIESEVIDIAGDVMPYGSQIRTIIDLVGICISHPLSAKKVIRFYLSQRGGSLTLNKSSIQALQRFNNTNLNRKVFTKKHIERLATSDYFDAFFSGSDQVWNGARVDRYYEYFLRFAPKEKRISWAASFGGSSIASYNINRYKKYIGEFENISVRENSGVELVSNLTGKLAVCLPDPVMLLTKEQWLSRQAAPIVNGHYILVFFIDKPSAKSVAMAQKMSNDKSMQIVTFGYQHGEFENARHKDGGPFEFLSAINHADIIVTDSYHAVVFATIFHKEFFANERQYKQNQKQSTRLIEFLSAISQRERFECVDYGKVSHNFDEADNYLDVNRERAEVFLERCLGEFVPNKTEKRVREFKYECCGCGACVDVCKHNAIDLKRDERGVFYPFIDEEKCVNCGLCAKICSFKPREKSAFKQKAFIIIANDKQLIKQSASGGIFAAMARKVIDEGGVVYGASLWVEEGRIKVEHIGVEFENELYRIQGSKYVQSKTQGIFPHIKDQLQSGREVLFGGTSCQVAALRGYLRKDYENLMTADLICHGVPSLQMLQDYIDSLGLNDLLIGLKFRKRLRFPYTLTLTLKDKNNKTYNKEICLRESAYYRLFMSNAGYRSSCYDCPFANINKPGDITLGDYYLNETNGAKGDYPQEIQNADLLSTVIVNTNRGCEMLESIKKDVTMHPTRVEDMVNHHGQLQNPSVPRRIGDTLLALYDEMGFTGVQNGINLMNRITIVPLLFKRVKSSAHKR